MLALCEGDLIIVLSHTATSVRVGCGKYIFDFSGNLIYTICIIFYLNPNIIRKDERYLQDWHIK